MDSQITRARELDAVHGTVCAITRALDSLGDQHACILHCMQPHRSNFYHQLERDFSARVSPCNPRGKFRAAIGKAIFGVPALILMDDHGKLPLLFSKIGEQAMAGLYVVNKTTLALVPAFAQLDASEIVAAVKTDPTHLVYHVDEDAAGGDGKVIELLSTGASCPKVLSAALDLVVTPFST